MTLPAVFLVVGVAVVAAPGVEIEVGPLLPARVAAAEPPTEGVTPGVPVRPRCLAMRSVNGSSEPVLPDPSWAGPAGRTECDRVRLWTHRLRLDCPPCDCCDGDDEGDCVWVDGRSVEKKVVGPETRCVVSLPVPPPRVPLATGGNPISIKG